MLSCPSWTDTGTVDAVPSLLMLSCPSWTDRVCVGGLSSVLMLSCPSWTDRVCVGGLLSVPMLSCSSRTDTGTVEAVSSVPMLSCPSWTDREGVGGLPSVLMHSCPSWTDTVTMEAIPSVSHSTVCPEQTQSEGNVSRGFHCFPVRPGETQCMGIVHKDTHTILHHTVNDTNLSVTFQAADSEDYKHSVPHTPWGLIFLQEIWLISIWLDCASNVTWSWYLWWYLQVLL